MRIHFLKTRWSDMIILQSCDCVALVDTGMPGQYDQLKDYLNKLNVKEIAFILLTHFHVDHYGCIDRIIRDFPVKTVYFKNYSRLDNTAANGSSADEQYRADEFKKETQIKECIRQLSSLINAETVDAIPFDQFTLQLFNNQNSIREIYEDASHPETYHKLQYKENQNSLAVFMKVFGRNILLGGDVLDKADTHPKANYVNYQIARQINEKIDVYKVPHHGTNHCNTPETLAIYQPRIAVITNDEEFLRNSSSVYEDLRRANGEVEILLTENHHIVIDIADDGHMTYEKVNE